MSKELIKILDTPVEATDYTMLDLIAITRKSKAEDHFEIALDDTGKWLSLPMAAVNTAEHAGVVRLEGTDYHVVKYRLKQRPGELWFELLAFVLERAALLYTPPGSCGCGCSGEGNGGGDVLPAGIHKRSGGIRSKTTVAHCVSCWIMTMGSAPSFCYKFGHCDN